MFSSTRRVCAAMSPSTSVAGRGIERHLPGDEQQLAGANGRRVRPDRLGRVGAEDGLFHESESTSADVERGTRP